MSAPADATAASAIAQAAPRSALRILWHAPAAGTALAAEVEARIAAATAMPVELLLCEADATASPAPPPCDVAVLEAGTLPHWLETLQARALPPLLLGDADSPRALVVSAGDAERTAACVWLLATDPPTRRRSLDALYAQSAGSAAAGPLPECWRVEGVFDTSYSLAAVNRQLALALAAQLAEAPVGLLSFEQGAQPVFDFSRIEHGECLEPLWQAGQLPDPVPQVALRNAWPPQVWGMQGRYRVLANYAWEESRFPAAFALQFNRTLDLITVVSEQTRRFLVDAGVNVPIAVVGNGVDHLGAADDAAAPLPCSLPEAFRFLHVSSCFPRKAVDVLLAAFAEAFRAGDPVCLLIKTFPNPHNTVREQVEQWRARDPGFPQVVLIEEDWSPGQILALYRQCQALVAAGRGEGFGLPIAEAMRLGLPVITSRWGGQMDFCDERSAWLVDGHLAPAQTHLSAQGSLWFEPDRTSLARRLREVYGAGPAQRQRRLDRARERIAPFTWARAARRTREALDWLRTQPGPLPATRIGWVSTWRTRCGVGMYSQYMVAGMAAEAVQVFAPVEAETFGEDEPFVTRCWQRGEAEVPTALIEALLAQRLDAVVIQCHWAFFSVAALVALITALDARGVHVYLDVHNTGDAPEELLRSLEARTALARCRRVLAHTLRDVSAMRDWGLLDAVTLFPLAAYPVPLPTPAQLAARRRELGLEGRRVVASYGFLMPHKGLMELLEAIALLRRSERDVHLLMVNAHYSEAVSGPEAQRIEARIAELGLEGCVTREPRFLPDEQSLELLRCAELVVFPYQHSNESSSAAVRMAIRGACPVAVTPLPIFEDVASAVITLPGTAPEQLAQGIGTALERLADTRVLDAQEPGSVGTTYAEGLRQRAAALAEEMSAARLAARMLGMIQGELRQVPVS